LGRNILEGKAPPQTGKRMEGLMSTKGDTDIKKVEFLVTSGEGE
jgi:hypothetical protein